ncbi:hypothetical protein PSCICL_29500 [Pseudomonas cichorii]|nr:hypothetical protein PSCICL_29500 [Pseudomonas cichorii]
MLSAFSLVGQLIEPRENAANQGSSGRQYSQAAHSKHVFFTRPGNAPNLAAPIWKGNAAAA